MAQYRDIDLPSGVTLRINGELSLPSNSLSLTTGNITVGGGATVNGSLTTGYNVISSGNIQVYGTGTINGLLTLGTQATGTGHAVRADRNINTSNGLTGGGNLTGDITLQPVYGGNGSATTIARSDHNHDSNYLNLTGGTLSGLLQANGGVTINGSIVTGGTQTIFYNPGFNSGGGTAFVGNWYGPNRWGIGTKSNSATDLKIGVTDGTNRLWSSGYALDLWIGDNKAWHSGNLSPVTTSRNISTGSGLTGGGDLSSDRTLSVYFGGNGTATTVSHSDP